MPSPDLTALDAQPLSAEIHAGRVSCREVMTAYLARIHRLNPRLNAIVNLAPDADLLRQADARDAELRKRWREEEAAEEEEEEDDGGAAAAAAAAAQLRLRRRDAPPPQVEPHRRRPRHGA